MGSAFLWSPSRKGGIFADHRRPRLDRRAQAMRIAVGGSLGPYEILESLGSGGMGEVYKAVDTRLGRAVAIKVLPEALSEDRERLSRFESEARAASALNHPNIVTIYDVGHDEKGEAYLAMELIEGETLRERLSLDLCRSAASRDRVAGGRRARRGARGWDRSSRPEARERNDPQDGLVKILDFGLAKSVPPRPRRPTPRRPRPQTSLTEPGVVLGTVGYMSPEQAIGKPADLHSDQFSLGAILYEMASGRRAFQRGTAVETLSAILRDEPPPIGGLGPTCRSRCGGSSSAVSQRSPGSDTPRRGTSRAISRDCANGRGSRRRPRRPCAGSRLALVAGIGGARGRDRRRSACWFPESGRVRPGRPQSRRSRSYPFRTWEGARTTSISRTA